MDWRTLSQQARESLLLAERTERDDPVAERKLRLEAIEHAGDLMARAWSALTPEWPDVEMRAEAEYLDREMEESGSERCPVRE